MLLLSVLAFIITMTMTIINITIIIISIIIITTTIIITITATTTHNNQKSNQNNNYQISAKEEDSRSINSESIKRTYQANVLDSCGEIYIVQLYVLLSHLIRKSLKEKDNLFIKDSLSEDGSGECESACM